MTSYSDVDYHGRVKIVALQFSSGKNIPIENAYDRTYKLAMENADVAQTTMDTEYLSFMSLP